MARKGSNKAKCQIYRDRGMRERNRALKLKKHLRVHPNDKVAKIALKAA